MCNSVAIGCDDAFDDLIFQDDVEEKVLLNQKKINIKVNIESFASQRSLQTLSLCNELLLRENKYAKQGNSEETHTRNTA